MTADRVPELLYLPYSPWSERARWALARRGVEVKQTLYSPLLGEPTLRLRLRRILGVVSVPVLFDGLEAIEGGIAIARYAEARGRGEALFPGGLDREIVAIDMLANRALDAGRTLSLGRILGDREALLEMVPRGLRSALGPLAVPTAALGIARTRAKYGRGMSQAGTRAELVSALAALTERVRAAGGTNPLLGPFTYADISAAQSVGFVAPGPGLALGAASRRQFGDPGLAGTVKELIAWRDAMYERYRGS